MVGWWCSLFIGEMLVLQGVYFYFRIEHDSVDFFTWWSCFFWTRWYGESPSSCCQLNIIICGYIIPFVCYFVFRMFRYKHMIMNETISTPSQDFSHQTGFFTWTPAIFSHRQDARSNLSKAPTDDLGSVWGSSAGVIFCWRWRHCRFFHTASEDVLKSLSKWLNNWSLLHQPTSSKNITPVYPLYDIHWYWYHWYVMIPIALYPLFAISYHHTTIIACHSARFMAGFVVRIPGSHLRHVSTLNYSSCIIAIIYVLVYIPETCECPLFGWLNPSKQGLFQSKQGSFGFQVYLNGPGYMR